MTTNHNNMNNPHDTGYKYLLSSKKAFMELIKSFIKTGWAEQVDETSLVRVDKTFILQDFKNQEADVIYQARLKDKDVIFYVLLELQSSVDFLIPYRLLLYMTEVWRDLFKNVPRKETERKDFRLPVIVPIVLYNNKAKWSVPLDFKGILADSDLFGRQIVDFQYILINVHSYDEKQLLDLSSLISSVFLVDQAGDLEEIIERLKKLTVTVKQLDEEEFILFKNWTERILTRNIEPEEKKEVASILKETRPEEVEQMISNVERVLKKTYKDAEKKGIEQGKEQGMEMGIEIGKELNMVKVARQMLLEDIDLEIIKRCTGLSGEALEKLK